jgi:alkylmercury lyase
MSTIEHDDASLAGFLAGWGKQLHERLPVAGLAVIGLTNFGEHPVQSTRLAEVLGRPVSEAEALAQGHCTTGKPVEDGYIRVEDGLITFNPERAPSAPRRQLQIGDRRVGMTGCAPDVILYAPLVRPSVQVEETCPATGTPIRIVFTPSRVEHVEPAGAVVAMPPVQVLDRADEMTVWEVDVNICAQCPFYSSAEAAQGWLADFHGGRVFPVREAWELSVIRQWRDKMSALLGLDH